MIFSLIFQYYLDLNFGKENKIPQKPKNLQSFAKSFSSPLLLDNIPAD